MKVNDIGSQHTDYNSVRLVRRQKRKISTRCRLSRIHLPKEVFTSIESLFITQFDPQILISDVYNGKIKY